MNTIREWAILLCCASIGSAFIIFIIPEGNQKKTANAVVTLFLLSVIVFPVHSKDKFDIDFPELSVDEFPDNDDYKSIYNDFLVDSSENMIKEQISATLLEICNDNFEIETFMQSNGDENISLSEIHIYVSEADYAYKTIIETRIGSLTGIIPQVVLNE